MNDRIVAHLKSAKAGDPQVYRNIVIFPMTGTIEGDLDYLTLGEALESRLLTVTEVTAGGSVPELKVTNSADKPVLLLDGEELAGAKQNRVLNTTVLVPAKQSVVIPVSCTEQGRWAYSTDAFFASGHLMAHSIRARKNQSVSESLTTDASFRSNQGEVWEGIAELQSAAKSPSPTSAMRDVFEAHSGSLDEAIKAFPLVPGQIGLLAVIDGQTAGFDLVSRAAAYGHLHGKLLKSYVMDGLVAKKKKGKSEAEVTTQAAHAFVERAIQCEEKTFKSVGMGDDYRFKGEKIGGSALVHQTVVIHTAFFQLDSGKTEGHMSGLNRRSAYRVY